MPTRRKPTPKPQPEPKDGMLRAVAKARREAKPAKSYAYPIQAPLLPKGVVPEGTEPLVAMDNAAYDYSRGAGFGGQTEWVGFPGYPYLSMLSTRAEYRMFAQAMSNNLTREWLKLGSTNTDDDATKEKITQLEQDLKDMGLKEVIALMADHDSFYGRAQLFLDVRSQSSEEVRDTPLLITPKTIKKETIKPDEKITKYFRVRAVEAMWTTPSVYNADDPTRDDFYKPVGWFMLGKRVHADRLLTVITRPVTDMLKPAFNFGGMSMSQLAEPYVDNWLRTRQSVSDLINNFSIVTMQTDMAQVLSGSDDGDSVMRRAEYFALTRNNKGMMLLDKEREEIVVQNVPLGGLDALQAQSQEQMCSVSHIPAVILLGISPTGFGNLAEGEIRAFFDWMRSLQYRDWTWIVQRVLEIIQLIRYGVIDSDITINWEPLYQMTPKEEAELRKADGDRDVAYITAGVLAPEEVREKLARNPDSGYEGLDVTQVPEPDNEGEVEDDDGAGD
jgi:uncharacterized protein